MMKPAMRKKAASKKTAPAKKKAPAKKASSAKKKAPANKASSAKKKVSAKKAVPAKKKARKKPAAKKIAEEITNKTKGFEFLANVNTSDILRWNLKNLAAKNK